MIKFIMFSLSIIYLFTFNKEILAQTGSIKKIRIDPAVAFGGKASDFFENIRYIPLETSSKSLFGEVDRLLVTDSSFVIFDFDTHSVLFFELNGKFITRVSGNTKTYLNIFLDPDDKRVGVQYFNDAASKDVISYFTYKGKLLKRETFSVSKQSTYAPMVSMENGFSARFNSAFLIPGDPPSDTITHLITIYRNKQLLRSLFPVSQKRDIGFCLVSGSIQSPKIVQNGGFYISTPLDYRLYHIAPSDTQFLFQFVFPAKRMFSKEIFNTTNNRYLDSIARKIADDENTIIDVSNIFFRGSKLHFKLNMRAYTTFIGSESKYLYNFIYDTIYNKLISLERIVSDEKSYFLPLFGNRVNVSGLEYHNEQFYTSISSLKMFTAYKNIKEKNVQFPEPIVEYFKMQTRKSNPVIVQLKFKN